jgi:glycosyltransferase involved in cell wall biosynthesis
MPTARRIAFIAPRFSEKGTVGGAETLLKALAERAADAGREVDFLTTCATNHFTWENTVPPGTQTFGKLRVTFFPVNDDRDVTTFLTVQGKIDKRIKISREEEEAWITNSVNSKALIEHLKTNIHRYDKIVAGPYLFGVSYFACQVAPEKTILVPCLHDEPFAYLSIMHDLLHGVSGLIFNAEPEKQLARRLYDFPERGTVVGMGIEDLPVDAGAFAKRHHITQPYVIYCGRRETMKGTPLLTTYMHTFRERTGRDVRMVFTGSGQIEAPEDFRNAILDVGFVSELEKREAMAGAVCFVHASLVESLGIVLLEAWLAGTPSLVHAKGVVLQDQCRRANGGLWFRHYPDFEECLLRLLDDKTLRDQLAESGRRFVLDTYSWEAVESRLFEAIDA